jgi:hypothetical protein
LKYFSVLMLFLKFFYSQSISIETIKSEIKLYPLNQTMIYLLVFEENRLLKLDFETKSQIEILTLRENEILDASSDGSGNLYLLNSFEPFLIKIDKFGNSRNLNPLNFARFQFNKIAFNPFSKLILLNENNDIYTLKLDNLNLEKISKEAEIIKSGVKSVSAIRTNDLIIELIDSNYRYQFTLNGIFSKKEVIASKKLFLNSYHLDSLNNLYKNNVLMHSEIIDFSVYVNSVFVLNKQNEVRLIKSE